MKAVSLAIALAAIALVGARHAPAQHADRIWSGGTILTMDDKAMRVEAVAERAGRIVAVGRSAEVMKLRGASTQVVDLAGRTLVPGFVDAHGHVVGGGLQALAANLLAPPDGKVDSIAALQQTLREWLAANADTARRVNLILGFGYDNAQLKELRHPTRDDLDAVSKELPIIVVHQSSHIAVVNSKALEVIGYGPQTKDPAGGVIRRRAGGSEPDGVLEETAFHAVIGKLLGGVGPQGLRVFAKAGAELWARFGYTTAQDGRSTPGVADVLRSVAAEGGLPIDVVSYVDVMAARDYALRHHGRSYVNRFRVGGGKLGIDGSPQGFTAWRDRPYYKPVGNYPPGYAGYGNVSREQAVEAVDWAFRNNVQILVHAAGETASDIFIAGLRAAEARHGQADRRPVLIHGHFMREDQIDAYRDLRAFPSLFPMHTFYWGDWHRDHTLGPVAGENLTPTGWAVTRGMKFTSHHDAPVAFPDSMRILDATVTRRTRSGDILGPHQRVDVITGLKAMTLWAAYQHFEETDKGSIEVGKLADFAILSKDPTAVPPDDIDQIKVTETVKEGRTVFALTTAEQRKAELMPRGRLGEPGPLQTFLQVNSAYRDLARGPALLQQVPGYVRAATDPARGPHDPACVVQALDDIVLAMLQGTAGTRR